MKIFFSNKLPRNLFYYILVVVNDLNVDKERGLYFLPLFSLPGCKKQLGLNPGTKDNESIVQPLLTKEFLLTILSIP